MQSSALNTFSTEAQEDKNNAYNLDTKKNKETSKREINTKSG